MPKRGYHHGNLRQALVDAALDLITVKGPTGFTLSQAAKAAGVTPAAVYRHFAGRDDLIAEAARQGYTIMDQVMRQAQTQIQTQAKPGALERFQVTCRTYLEFARQYPGHYIAMFESGVPVSRTEGLNTAATQARSVLDQAVHDLVQLLPPGACPPDTMFANHIWALSHGVVELFARNSTGIPAPYSPEEMLERGVNVYLRGLGVRLDND